MPRDGKPSEKRLATRARLIEAAARAISEKGFRETTLDEIAAYAGLTKGAIYDNFRSKEALFLEVMLASPSRLALPQERSGSTADRLAAIARGAVSGSEAQAALQIPLRAEFLLYTLSHPHVRPQVEAWVTSGFAGERERLSKVFAEGELPMSVDAFVLMMQAMIPGLQYIKSQAPDLVRDELVDEIFAALAPRK